MKKNKSFAYSILAIIFIYILSDIWHYYIFVGKLTDFPLKPLGLRFIKWAYCCILGVGAIIQKREKALAWYLMLFASIGIIITAIVFNPFEYIGYNASLLDAYSCNLMEIISIGIIVIFNKKSKYSALGITNRKRWIAISLFLIINLFLQLSIMNSPQYKKRYPSELNEGLNEGIFEFRLNF